MSHSENHPRDHGAVRSEWELPLISHLGLAKLLAKLSRFCQLQNRDLSFLREIT